MTTIIIIYVAYLLDHTNTIGFKIVTRDYMPSKVNIVPIHNSYDEYIRLLY